MKIKKYQMIEFLRIFKKLNCETVDDIIQLLNKELKKDTDIVFECKGGVIDEQRC